MALSYLEDPLILTHLIALMFLISKEIPLNNKFMIMSLYLNGLNLYKVHVMLREIMFILSTDKCSIYKRPIGHQYCEEVEL